MDIKSNVTHVILTGGVGSRLWPLSRRHKPKQYLELFGGKSLLEMTVARNATFVDHVVIVGNLENYSLTCSVMDKFTIPHNHIIESTARNTAAAIAFAAFQAHPDSILIVTPADHIIEGEVQYASAVNQALNIAQQNYLVTFGVKPSKPETGYGYIEFEGENVLAFHEKPNIETAHDFLQKGNYFWNSGLFCFKAGLFLAELEKQEPTVFHAAKLVWESNVEGVLDYELSLKIPSISVDYAVMERSDNIKVVPAHFEWSDLGSFEAVYDYLLQSDSTAVDLNGNIVIGSSTHTSFVGVENTILVHTPDAFLVLQKEKSQDVKQVYQYLESIDSHLI